MAIRHQPSPEVRDFLIFYLLEQVASGAFPPARLGSEVVLRSAGDLQPAEADVRAAQTECWERGWLRSETPFSDEPASLSPEGRLELERRLEAGGSREPEPNSREEAGNHIVSLLSPPDLSEVLDVGTGDGFLAKKLASVGFRVLGVDIDGEAIERAVAGKGAEARLRFESADIHALAKHRRRWSRIVTSYFLHECDEPIGALRAICSCLSPGGRLACMDFAPSPVAYLLRAGRTPFHSFRALAQGDWLELGPRLGLARMQFFHFGYVAVTYAESDGATE
jgi:SAM-dependent methyltransferase